MITTVRIREGFEAENKNFAQKYERSLSEVLSEVLSSKDYVKLLPIIEHLENNDSITPKIAETLTKKSSATARGYLGLLVSTKIMDSRGSTTSVTYHRVK